MERIVDCNQLQQFLNYCRLCGADNPDKVPIFEEDEELFGDVAPLWKKIEECVAIQVCKNDQMPQEICLQCIDKVNDFFEYRAVCAATDSQTRAILNVAPDEPESVMIKIEPLEVSILSESEACVSGEAQACTMEDEDTAKQDFHDGRLSTADTIEEKPKKVRRTRRFITNGDRELMVRAYESGYTVTEIGKIFNFKRTTVSSIIETYTRHGRIHANFRTPPSTKKLTPQQEESVKQWHTADRTLTYEKLARKVYEAFGVKVAPITVCRVMKPRWYRERKNKQTIKTEPTEVPILPASEAYVKEGAQACTAMDDDDDDDDARKGFLVNPLSTAENIEQTPKTRIRCVISNGDREQIVRAYENGCTITKIGEMCKLKPKTVSSIIDTYTRTGRTRTIARSPPNTKKLAPQQEESEKQWHSVDRTLSYDPQACTAMNDDDADTKDFLVDPLATAENIGKTPKTRTRRFITNEEKERIVRAYENGCTITNIGDMYNFKRTTVSTIIDLYKRTGRIHAKARRPIASTKKLTPQQEERIKQWRTADRSLSYEELARKVYEVFGVKVAPTTVSRVMKPRRYCKSKTKQTKTEPIEAWVN